MKKKRLKIKHPLLILPLGVLFFSGVLAVVIYFWRHSDYTLRAFFRDESIEELYERGKPERALTKLKELPPQEQGTAQNLLLKGKLAYLYTWKKYEESEWKEYARNPDDWFTSSVLPEGISALQSAARVEETAQEALLYLALIYMEKGQYSQAADYFQRLLQKNPSHPLGLLNYGVFLSRREKYEDAVEVLERGRDLYPDNLNFLKNLFWIYAFKLEDYDRAVTYGDTYVKKARNRDGIFDLPTVIADLRDILSRFPEYDSDTLNLRKNEPPRFEPRESAKRMREERRRKVK
jgi:tetratricopeptide (TPR) repeat protein